MTNMNVSEFLRGVDHAAAKDDRWLFIASLVLLGLFGVWVVRYFVKQHEQLLADHSSSSTVNSGWGAKIAQKSGKCEGSIFPISKCSAKF
jgi:hypothetical protein